MSAELSNLALFFLALAKVAVLCGFAPAILIFYALDLLEGAGRVPALIRWRRGESRQEQHRERVGTHPIGSQFGDELPSQKISGRAVSHLENRTSKSVGNKPAREVLERVVA